MAVLGEILIFSWRGNCCHSWGLRTLGLAAEAVREIRVCEGDATDHALD